MCQNKRYICSRDSELNDQQTIEKIHKLADALGLEDDEMSYQMGVEDFIITIKDPGLKNHNIVFEYFPGAVYNSNSHIPGLKETVNIRFKRTKLIVPPCVKFCVYLLSVFTLTINLALISQFYTKNKTPLEIAKETAMLVENFISTSQFFNSI